MFKKINKNLIGKSLLTVLVVILLTVCGVFATLFMQSWREFDHFSKKELDMRYQLASIRTDLTAHEQYLRKLLEDDAFLEHVIRDRMVYSRGDELVFRFQ